MLSTENKVSNELLTSVNGATKQRSNAEQTQDRFITLLVTQLKNQDPLNPLDNAQVTSQLAQLSTVTGIDKLNDTMGDLISSVQSSQALQASSLIGRSVLVESNKFRVIEGQGAFAVSLTNSADSLKAEIKDASGRVVRTIDLGSKAPGTFPVVWNGLNEDGVKLPDGIYGVTFEALLGGKPTNTSSLTYAGVTSINTENSNVKLQLDNGLSVATTAIREIL